MRIITTVIALLMAVANVNAQENVDFNVWPKVRHSVELL